MITMISRGLFNSVLALFACLVLTSLVLRRYIQKSDDKNGCHNLLKHGRWSHDLENSVLDRGWNPQGCFMRSFTSSEVKVCLKNRNMIFIGDSNARQLYWAVARKMNHSLAQSASMIAEKHTNLSFVDEDASILFFWDPFLNITNGIIAQPKSLGGLRNSSTSTTPASNAIYIMGSGLWHARYLENDFVNAFNTSFSKLTVSGQAILLPIIQPLKKYLHHEHLRTLTVNRVQSLNHQLDVFSHMKGFEVMWSASDMAEKHVAAYQENGIHLVEEVTSAQANILLSYICNPGPLSQQIQSKNGCCGHHSDATPLQSMLLHITSLMIIFSTFATLVVKTKCHAYTSRLQFISLKKLQGLAIFSASILYCYLADRTNIFEKSSKVVDDKLFLAMVLISLVVGTLTVTSNVPTLQSSKPNELAVKYDEPFLSRQQTEEWKGWMQVVILLYHYFGMSQRLWIYKIIRLLVASYLFMTGFGHSLYSLKTKDRSLRRALTVLVRQNLLSSILPYIMDTQYDFYYFPMLSSLWFIITWATIGRNYKDGINLREICLRVAISMIIIRNIFKSEYFISSIFNLLHQIGMMRVNLEEFRFRFMLDWQIAYYGMVTAALYLKYQENRSLTIPKVWPRYMQTKTLSIPFLTVAVLIFTAYITFSKYFPDKYQYNRWHALISPWPVLAFVILRNATPPLRRKYSKFFAWIGRFSLETFVLQYHIWLAADTKALLHLGIIDKGGSNSQSTVSSWTYWVEAAFITTIFLWISSAMRWSASVLTAWIVGKDSEENARGLGSGSDLQERGLNISKPMPQEAAHFSVAMQMRVIFVIGTLWILNLLW